MSIRKMKEGISYIMFVLASLLLLQDGTVGEPRSQTVQIMCGDQPEHNSTAFVANFVSTMENISQQVRTSRFVVVATGSGPDTNYGLVQCYGDLSSRDCVLCYAQARNGLPQCYPFTSGRIYLDGCFMRSENYSFYEEYSGPEDTAVCGNTTRKGSDFEAAASRAVSKAVSNAPKNKGYARVQVRVSGTGNESAYVLADCWGSLSVNSCRICLKNALESVTGCLPWSEGRALNTGCFLRYSDTDFLNPMPGNGRSRGTVNVVAVATVSSAVLWVIAAVIGAYIWKHCKIQKKREGSNDVAKLVKTLNDSSLNFKYSTLEQATASFDDANKLGHGGFGAVYKGVLQDGREIGVKRLFFNNKHRAADFYNEVNMISSVEHKNLVRLLGCRCSGPESLLVYEYLPNRSLDHFIFDSDRGKEINWEKRFQVIIGTAEGLVYLHENTNIKIIHRDIKASNILLDSRLRAKIADFGLARSFQEDQSHISTAIAGTLGYMAPEYLAHGQLTEKADVYSYGVLLLEIVTGRQNNRSRTSEYSDSLVAQVWRHFQQGRAEELFDPNLMLHNYFNNNIKSEILRTVHIGLMCTQKAPSLRPTMSKALQMLTEKDKQIPPPTNPPFIDETRMELNDAFNNPNYPLNGANSASIANISHSSFYPR